MSGLWLCRLRWGLGEVSGRYPGRVVGLERLVGNRLLPKNPLGIFLILRAVPRVSIHGNTAGSQTIKNVTGFKP
jgi:hypothetical protein